MTYKFDPKTEAALDHYLDYQDDEDIREVMFNFFVCQLADMEVKFAKRARHDPECGHVVDADYVRFVFVQAVNAIEITQPDENHRGIHTCDGRCKK